MKNILLVFCFVLYLSFLNAQTNLVPNPSFELYDTCVTSLSQIRATGWASARPSPDYFNSCSSSPDVSVPSNFWGYQYPASGNAYAGFAGKYGHVGVREYLGTQLINPLQVGTKYYISFKVSLSTNVNAQNYCGINKLGVLFSTIHYSDSNLAPICNCAQVYTNNIITDTTNWTMIKGSFVADSNYSFISIGNFFTDLMIDSIQVTGNECVAYYYLDNICVSTDSVYSYNYVWTGIEDNINNHVISIYPNPATGQINIDASLLNEPYDIAIYDVLGREVFFKQKIKESIELIPIENINSDILFIQIKYKNKLINNKIIKIKS